MSVKYIATDKHLYMKAGTEITVMLDGRFSVSDFMGSENLLKAWIMEGWCVVEEFPKWTDSELKEMCIAYANHINSTLPAIRKSINAVEEAFDQWLTDRTNPDSFEVRS